MPAIHKLTVRLTPAQYRDIERLEQKLHLDKTSLIRFALARLAESEGVLNSSPGRKS